MAEAAGKTGRVWALSFDIAGLSADRIFDVLTAEWKRLVEAKITAGPRYLHEGGLPVVQVWGFYWHNKDNAMTPELAEKLIAFFGQPGRYRAFLAGGGDWDWRRRPDPAWQRFCHTLRRVLAVEHRQLPHRFAGRQARSHAVLGRRQARL